MHKICTKCAKICKNMQKYAGHFMQQKYAKICKLYVTHMQNYAKYAILICICKICTPHFADARLGDSEPGCVPMAERVTVTVQRDVLARLYRWTGPGVPMIEWAWVPSRETGRVPRKRALVRVRTE